MGPTKILCLGDSLTEGYNVLQEKGWVQLVTHELGTPMINAGISGDSTTGMLGRCERLLNEHKPSHMIVMGGTNDILFGLKNEFIISNIHAISRYARYYGVECLVGIPTSIIKPDELNFIGENVGQRMERFKEALVKYCKDDKKAYIDFSADMTLKHYQEDGVHLNEWGHQQMKTTFLNYLKS